MKRNYKVLHIFSGVCGGIPSFILRLIQNTPENITCDTLAFSYDNGGSFVKDVEETGACCFCMPRPRIDGFRKFFDYLNQLFRDNKYDAVHCHISGWRAIVFKVLCVRYEVKTFILHAHTTRYDSKIDRLLIHINRVVNNHISSINISCSSLAANYVFGRKCLRKRKVVLIPNGIDTADYLHEITEGERDNLKKSLGVECNTKVLMHVGRLSWPKNHEFLFTVMKKIKEQNKNYVLLLVGDGERYEDLKNEVTEMGIDNLVIFCGRRFDIPLMMQMADCMLLPSKNEGLPTVAIESQASGTPMILSDNVTKECDMGMNMLRFLSLEDYDIWIKTIDELCINYQKKIPIDMRLDIIDSNGFTSRSIGIAYSELIKNEVDHRRIE